MGKRDSGENLRGIDQLVLYNAKIIIFGMLVQEGWSLSFWNFGLMYKKGHFRVVTDLQHKK